MIDLIKIHRISPKLTLPIRQKVLRNGKIPKELCEFNWDYNKESFHLGAYFNKNIIGIVSILNTSKKKSSVKRLRGMAVLSPYQKSGIGSLLIDEAEKILKNNKTSLIWLKARKYALDFYLKKGYKKTGNPFDIEDIGIHYKCEKKIL
ncbi:MAG: GNAT family N-acetyltransferase [Flavobacteriaceae bacterium]|nr:GNAT family N-acetyltransferase [Flavobacteriaceae bacterium]